MRNSIGWIVLFILLNSLSMTPAEAGDDRQFWNTLVLHHALNKKLESHLAMHSRELDDISTLGVYYAAPGILYTLTEHLVFGLNYKFQRLKAKSVWTNEHRIEIQPIVKWNWDRLKFSLRNRLEYRNVEGVVEWRLRERFRFKRAVNWGGFKFAPFISDEFFYSFKTDGLSQNRIMVGASKNLTRQFGLDIFYMYKSNNRRGDWFGENVIGTNFSLRF